MNRIQRDLAVENKLTRKHAHIHTQLTNRFIFEWAASLIRYIAIFYAQIVFSHTQPPSKRPNMICIGSDTVTVRKKVWRYAENLPKYKFTHTHTSIDAICKNSTFECNANRIEKKNKMNEKIAHVVWNYIHRIKYLMWLNSWAAFVWFSVGWFFRFVGISCDCRAVSDSCQAKLIRVKMILERCT